MLNIIIKIKSWYERLERFNPVVFFFGGFTWDSITLKRIDQVSDNIILLVYLIALGILMVITILVEHQRLQHGFIMKHRKFFPLGLQFFLGGLFSAYVIFYFQSASFTKTSVFLGILVLLFVANEFLKSRLTNIYLLLGLYFLACFSFFIFFIPVITRMLNVFTFLAGGIISLGLALTILWFLNWKEIFASRTHYLIAAGLILSLFASLNLLYFFNRIPPVPLALRGSGIYHHASKDPRTDLFKLKFEKPEWYQPLKNSDRTFHYMEGDTISCYTAVFAPTELSTTIYHHWQQYFPTRKEWLTTDHLGYQITGYRDGGYRGITRKQNITPGKWRVDVETESGVLIGRIGFYVKQTAQPIELKTIER